MKYKIIILCLILLTIFSVPLNGEIVTIDGWDIENIDFPVGGVVDFELDSNNNPHIVYLKEISSVDLEYRYVRKEDTKWVDENFPFEISDSIKRVSFKLDSKDNPHFVYYLDETLYYATRSENDWMIEEIDDVGSSSLNGGRNVLCIDQNDNPHVLFLKGSGYFYEYKWKENNEWKGSRLLTEGNARTYFSMALDRKNHPHIGFFNEDEHRLKYMTYNGSAVVIETVDQDKEAGTHCSIDVSIDGTIHISYKDWARGDLRYACRNEGSWKVEILDFQFPNYGSGVSSLQTDKNGNVHIGYKTESQTRYALKEGNKWNIYYFDDTFAGSSQESVVLRVDSNNNPHIVYYRPEDESLRYSTLVGDPRGVEENWAFSDEYSYTNLGWFLIPAILLLIIISSIITYIKVKKPIIPEIVSTTDKAGNQINWQKISPNNRTLLVFSRIVIGSIILILIILPFLPFWAHGYYYEERSNLYDDVNTIEEEYNEDFSIIYRSGYDKKEFNDNMYDGMYSNVSYYYLPGGGEFPSEMSSDGWNNDPIIPTGPPLLILYYIGPIAMLVIFFNFLVNSKKISIKKKKVKIIGIVSSILVFIFPIIFLISFQILKFYQNFNIDFSKYYDSIHMGIIFYLFFFLAIPIFLIAFSYEKIA